MDYQDDLLKKINFPLWIFVFTLFFTYIVLKKFRLANLPPGPWGLPIVGYLPFLGSEPHRELYRLSKKYGDVFGVYLGTTYVVVLTDYATAKEYLNRPSTADRPPDIFKLIPDGVGLGESNGPEWVQQRRYTVHKLKNLGLGGSDWENLVQEEVKSFLDIIAESNGQPVDILKPLSASVSNNVITLVSGERLPLGDPRRDIVDEGVESFETISSQSGLISIFPRLFEIFTKLGLISGKEKIKAMERMNKLVRETADEAKRSKDGHSYINEYLLEIEKNKVLDPNTTFNERNLIGNVQALIIAGSDTTKVSLTWLFLAMASFPKIQDKVQAEIDRVLGREGEPFGWVDRQRLPYCHAAILEGQRWKTVAPLNVLHRTNSDTTIGDYVVPKGSSIICLLWAFHINEEHWPDPDDFRPERFLDQDGKVLKKIENFAPFSFGKRSCIGETIAYIEMFLYFVGVMQRFRILPASDSTQPILEGHLGLIFQADRQPLRFVPR